MLKVDRTGCVSQHTRVPPHVADPRTVLDHDAELLANGADADVAPEICYARARGHPE